MADESRVRVEFLRPYPLGGVTHLAGSVADVPAPAVPRMLAGSPPFARVVDDDTELVEAVDATPGARDLADEKGLDLTDYHGQGSGPGGRIWKEDVERWAADGG